MQMQILLPLPFHADTLAFVYIGPILNLDLPSAAAAAPGGPHRKSRHKIRCFSALQMLIRIQIGAQPAIKNSNLSATPSQFRLRP